LIEQRKTRLSESTRFYVVTGGASGIGKAVCRQLAGAGHQIAILDRDYDPGAALARELGGKHIAIEVDVASEDQVRGTFERIAEVFPRIDALAVCAGINNMTPFEQLNAEIFAKLYAVNVTGAFLCMRETIKHMPTGGRICTVSSVAGLRGGGVFGTAAYAASKGAIIALSKTAARSLAPRNIAVNCVVPGPVETPMLLPHWHAQQRERVQSMIPLGRAGKPDEVANVICWLLNEQASFITGATIVADGGMIMY
jgi:NAD(P)-dependent dehydrogenase (short-subunit alcohol dehydrogenase family)